MIRKIIDSAIITALMQAQTVLVDDFGNQMIVQTNLAVPGVDHAADVAREMAVMQTNEDAFVAGLKQMGMTDDAINALKK